MKYALALAAAMALSGCLQSKPKAPPPPPIEFARDDCFTVVMFSDAEIAAPGEDIPAEWAQYSGVWGKGAWNGKWCHDLYVTSIASDGTVEVIDAHAPYEPWAKPATAFRRTGRISDDGKLYLSYGPVRVVYELQQGMLVGRRREGRSELEVHLSRQEEL